MCVVGTIIVACREVVMMDRWLPSTNMTIIISLCVPATTGEESTSRITPKAGSYPTDQGTGEGPKEECQAF